MPAKFFRHALGLLVERDSARTETERKELPTKKDIGAELAALEKPLRERGIASLALFGSTVRGQERADSDIDVLVDIDPKASFSLIDLVSVKLFLENRLGREVDVVTRRGDRVRDARQRGQRGGIRVLTVKSLTVHADHIIEAIANIEADIANHDIESFRADRRVCQLVERNLEIISEASRRLPQALKDKERDIPWDAVAGIGNVLRHEYHRIHASVLWETCRKDLKPLKGGRGANAVRP